MLNLYVDRYMYRMDPIYQKADLNLTLVPVPCTVRVPFGSIYLSGHRVNPEWKRSKPQPKGSKP